VRFTERLAAVAERLAIERFTALLARVRPRTLGFPPLFDVCGFLRALFGIGEILSTP
jgi:hypothetical protein